MNTSTNDACQDLRTLKVAFGAQRVLDGLDWSLPTGRVVGLLGRNGAGKTMPIETLPGLRKPDADAALLFGQPSRAFPDHVRASGGAVIVRGPDARTMLHGTPTVSGDPATLDDLFLALTA